MSLALDYDPAEERAAFIKRTEANGYTVVAPKDNELQVDIDTDAHYLVFLNSMRIAERDWQGGITFECHPSKSGLPRRHITVKLPFNVGTWQRIAMQAAFGSDPMREILSCTRVMRGDELPTLFIEVPNAQ